MAALNDNQKSQIRDLYADFYKQKYPKEKRKEAMEKLITDITAVLTSDQQVLYKQLQGSIDFRPAGALQAIAGGGSSRKTETRT